MKLMTYTAPASTTHAFGNHSRTNEAKCEQNKLEYQI